ncbi:hypothetical protein M404DRAFT_750967 [Pisolithus tinctorius Marx 270]|uniref:Uncharacterized protein n=1 Tax=Pisolithus tinctorius Marx 270 TaxID=870435 RepID=A0A0C3KRX3_PISTI|nr:hypothetical protein M404DRAFT_750967 [Pisolithus tinctorius Marx 270]
MVTVDRVYYGVDSRKSTFRNVRIETTTIGKCTVWPLVLLHSKPTTYMRVTTTVSFHCGVQLQYCICVTFTPCRVFCETSLKDMTGRSFCDRWGILRRRIMIQGDLVPEERVQWISSPRIGQLQRRGFEAFSPMTLCCLTD